MDKPIKHLFTPTTDLVFTSVENNRLRLVQAFRTLSARTLTLDVSQVTHCDSAGLAFLIEAKRLARQYKKRLRIEGMPDNLLALATFCGVQTLLETGK